MIILSLQGIKKSFGTNEVLKDASLTLQDGERMGLVGVNGCGKSTLMNVLFGMPVIHNTGGFQGSIEIEGKETRILTLHF